MRYESTQEAHDDHIKNYRSDGLKKGKGSRYASDYLRVQSVINSIPDNSRVLDIGCNTGTIAVRLQKKGCYVKGIDIVEELVKKAQKNGVFAEVGTAEDLSRFENESFDNVVCTEVLEHLFDPMPAIKEAYRVLKPGGSYIVSVPHPDGVMAEGLGDYHHKNYGIEELDTLFHFVFKRGQVKVNQVPYVMEYAHANGIDPARPQWLMIQAVK